VVDRVLELRPWYRLVLRSKELIESEMVPAAYDELDPREATRLGLEARQAELTTLQLDPDNLTALTDLGLTQTDVGGALWASGRLDEAIGLDRKALDPLAKAADNETFEAQTGLLATQASYRQAVAGDLQGAERTAASSQRLIEHMFGRVPPGSLESLAANLPVQILHAEAAYERADFAGASRLTAPATERLSKVTPRGEPQKVERAYLLFYFSGIYGRAEYQLGHFAAAERATRLALAERKLLLADDLSALATERDLAEISTWLSMALARQGKLREASQVIGPIVSFEHGLLARDHGDVWVPYELAGALYAQSLCDPARRGVLLRRASALLNGLPPRLQKLHDVQQWRRMISRQ
jgi:tetratricopeptide (TPR) repeat protein